MSSSKDIEKNLQLNTHIHHDDKPAKRTQERIGEETQTIKN